MKFRTEIKALKTSLHLDPKQRVTLMGSCFSDNIGRKIAEAAWPACVNPCGVVYNPATIALLIQLSLTHRPQRRAIVESSVTSREGKYVSWFVDSGCAADTPEGCTDLLMERLDRLEEAIETSECLVVTFGTPDVWLLRGTDRLVGNCHKHPASEFEKHRLGIEEIVSTWTGLTLAMRQRNPNLKLILTVSPRRYLGGGASDNSRLKAVLLLACEKIADQLADCCYFPAYEIMIDDLRDYRFYAEDMLHPSPIAVDYIWETFKASFLSEDDRNAVTAAEKEGRRLRHRPIL